MKTTLHIAVLTLLLASLPAVSETVVTSETAMDAAPVVAPKPDCPEADSERVLIQAKTVQQVGETIRAAGNVLFQKGRSRLTAADAYYNVESQTGELTRATFTTCTNTGTPDYRIVARELKMLPNDRILGRGIALYLGNTRVLGLPFIKMRVGGGGATRNIFPSPGYDQEDGYTLSKDFRLVDRDNLRVNADLELTSRNGLYGQFYALHGLDGALLDLPGRQLSYDSVRATALEMPVEWGYDCPEVPGPDPEAARFRAFGTFTIKQRTYDIGNKALVVYRQPELGVTYLGNPINITGTPLDPRLEIYPEVTASWGQYRESPGMSVVTGRGSLSASIAANLYSLGRNTAVQPFVSYTWSDYESGEDYRTSSFGLDVSHLWRSGSLVSARYITRNEAGATPFQFDDVDVEQELQGAIQLQMRKHVAGLAIGYDLDEGSVYDWEVMYGWRSDCLFASARYNQRLKRLHFDVGIIHL